MQIKSVILDNIHYINFITFDMSTLFFSWFALLKLGCVLYTVKYGKYIGSLTLFNAISTIVGYLMPNPS